MKPNILKEKSFEFALDIISLYKMLNDKKEFVLSRQILRSGTSIGANVREAQYAESKADFVHKLSIALKEANETQYWLELVFKSGYVDEDQYKCLNPKVTEQVRLLTSIINTTKSNY